LLATIRQDINYYYEHMTATALQYVVAITCSKACSIFQVASRSKVHVAGRTSFTVSSIHAILAPFYGAFYCYDIPRYIMTLATLVSSRNYRR